MSRTRQEYRARTIEVTTSALRDGGFTAHFDLEKHSGTHIDVTHFESGQIFKTDEEALAAGLELAKRKVEEGYKAA